eukprot:1898786-Alexandrium_andersonii.AAC.1
MATKPHAAVHDVMHSPERCPSSSTDDSGEGHRCSTVVPGSTFWVRDRARLLVGVEHLRLQGYPTEDVKLDDVSNSMLCDLAGNAFAATTYLTMLFAVMLATPPLGVVEHETGEDD